MDIAFYVGIRVWAILKSLCRMYVAWAYHTIMPGTPMSGASSQLCLLRITENDVSVYTKNVCIYTDVHIYIYTYVYNVCRHPGIAMAPFRPN